MKTFTDATGRDWPVEINFGALKRVKDLVGVDLLTADALKQLRDLIVVVDIIYAVCKPAAVAANLDPVAFADTLVPCFDDAVEAFFAELEDFFRRLNRVALASLIQKIRTWSIQEQEKMASLVTEEAMERKVAEILGLETEKARTSLHAELDRLIAGGIAADLPASSGSTSDR